MRIGIANAAEVDLLWPRISDRMQIACDRTGGASSSGELWQMCRSGDGFLIVCMDQDILCASVWRFETWPSGQVFRCLALCGSQTELWFRELHEYIRIQARIGGTERLVAQGRKGWRRLYERYVSGHVKTLWETYEV